MTSENILSIDGTVSFRERIALPPGAVATVKLVDGEGEVLAGTAMPVGLPPVGFTLTVDPGFVADPDHLFVWAALRSEVGTWGTLDLVRVESDTADVMLTRIDG